MLNVVIAVIQFLAQFLAVYLGWRLIRDPLARKDTKRKRRFETSFIMCGIVGALTIAVTAYRAGRVERAHLLLTPGLNYILEKEFYGPTANQWARASEFLPVGQPARLQINFENVGSGPAVNVTHGGRVYIEPDDSLSSVRDAVAKFDAWVKLQSPLTKTTIDRGQKGYVTFEGDLLTPEDLENITSGRRIVFSVGAFWFDDDFGSHYHNVCQFLQAPMEGGRLISATCREHTDEK